MVVRPIARCRRVLRRNRRVVRRVARAGPRRTHGEGAADRRRGVVPAAAADGAAVQPGRVQLPRAGDARASRDRSLSARAGGPRERRPRPRPERGRSVLATHDRAVRPAVPVDRERDRGDRGVAFDSRRAPAPRPRRGRARAAGGVRAAAGARARRRSGARDVVGAAQPARPARVGGTGTQRSFDDWSGGRRRHIRHRATGAAGHCVVCVGGDDQAAGSGRDSVHPRVLRRPADADQGRGRRRRRGASQSA